MTKSMTWRVLGSTMVCRHLDMAPADADWNHFAAGFRNSPIDRLLVWAPGGAAPSSSQRATIVEVFRAKPECRAAVLTNSKLTRGAAVAIGWFVPTLRAFEDTNVAGAVRFLELDEASAARVIAALEQLAVELAA